MVSIWMWERASVEEEEDRWSSLVVESGPTFYGRSKALYFQNRKGLKEEEQCCQLGNFLTGSFLSAG